MGKAAFLRSLALGFGEVDSLAERLLKIINTSITKIGRNTPNTVIARNLLGALLDDP